ncbi:hypothetical protein GCM10010472_03040 [Pseudonocardia halophobica]|uniref:Alpha/beta hydrolase fold-3 domain-containing protein n=1 Tax=Pseudonocardia halophobica TaxID=29401 RepID=A0A9W6L3W6_9PSEU|nr:hypothetical protein GCM10017577_17840 [Pseudonocardia halophobica]
MFDRDPGLRTRLRVSPRVGFGGAVRSEDLATAAGTRIRSYRPEGTDLPRHCLVFAHGGGWTRGDLDTQDHLVRSVSEAAGCLALSVDYRLAPTHHHPAPLLDLADAVDHAATLLADGAVGGQVVVAGASAGGHLTATTLLRLPAAARGAVGGMVLLYPKTDLTDDGERHPSLRRFDGRYGLSRPYGHEAYLGPAQRHAVEASPIHAVGFEGMPRTLVVTAELDPFRDEGEEFARLLDQAGVPTATIRFGGTVHGFLTHFPDSLDFSLAVASIASFIRTTKERSDDVHRDPS